jgi:DNA polymerase-3 subunit epsilon
LNLVKPLIVFDIESTGLNVTRDRIVELSLLKIFPDGTEEKKRYLLNPGIPISREAEAVHGISNEAIADCPSFNLVAEEIINFIGDSDLAGFNSMKFDVPMLMEEFFRAGYDLQVDKRNLIDAQVIFHKMEERTLIAAYRFYCDKELVNAHSAEADVNATWEVLKAQLNRYEGLPKEPKALAEWMGNGNKVDLEGRLVKNDRGEIVFNFGKHKGRTVASVFSQEPAYYSWMMGGDFSSSLKRIITRIKSELDPRT